VINIFQPYGNPSGVDNFSGVLIILSENNYSSNYQSTEGL